MNPVSTFDVASALGCSKQAVLSRAHAERWPAKRSGKSITFITSGLPNDVVRSLVAAGTVEPAHFPSDTGQIITTSTFKSTFKQCREKDRELAQQRATLLSLYRSSGASATAFVCEYNAGHISRIMRETLGPISQATFYRWLDAWHESKIDGLVPRWYNKGTSSEALSDIAKGYLEYYYLDPRRPSAMTVWRKVSAMLPQAPSYQTALRYLKSLPNAYVDFKRLGRSKFEAANFAYIERDPYLYLPMDQLVSDHHCFDFLVERDGKLFRPWITAVQDYRSSKIVGFCPVVYPSSLSIALAFYITARRFGAAKMIHIDNGKDYRSILMRGRDKRITTLTEGCIPEEEIIHIAGALNVFADDVTYAMPYHGQSKGRIERWFGTFAGFFSKSMSSYVGSDTRSRPEDVALFWKAINKQTKRHDVVTWDNFVHGLAEAVDWYNENWRGEGKGMDGKTPNEVFAELAPPPRTVDEETLVLAFSRAEVRVVFENGVRLDGVSFWSDKLIGYLGQQVLVRRSILAPNEAVVCDAAGRLIATAKADWFKETGDLAADNERVRSARKKVLQLVKDSSAMRDRAAGELGSLSRISQQSPVEAAPLAASGEYDVVAPDTTATRSYDMERERAFIDMLGGE